MFMPRFLLVFGLAAIGAAQTTPPQAEPKKEEESLTDIEAEFVASDIFRSGSYVQPMFKKLSFEGHYFGGEHTDVGYTGGSWNLGIGEFKLLPGFGVLFGSNEFAVAPALALRWDYERGWFVTQGLIIQGFRRTPIFSEEETEHHELNGRARAEPVSYVRPTISDGSHVSARWKRLTAGGTWEHIQFREGDEWKGGGRISFRLLPRVSAVLNVLGPGRAEWRGGILIHPPQHH